MSEERVIYEVKNEPHRVFAKIDYTWMKPEGVEDVEFFIRPMNCTERNALANASYRSGKYPSADNDFAEQEILKRIMCSCVSKVRADGKEFPLTADVYEEISDNSVYIWLYTTLQKISYLTKGEKLGL